MKRYLIAGLIIVALLVLFLHWRGNQVTQPGQPDSPRLIAKTDKQVPSPSLDSNTVPVKASPGTTNRTPQEEWDLVQSPAALQARNDRMNAPVAFYGLVVDQDSNALPNVIVDMDILELHEHPGFRMEHTATPIRKQTGADGRFEILGPKGNSVAINSFTLEGYELDMMLKQYKSLGARNTDFDHPAVFIMWPTNVHEQLISGEKSFAVVPDGRHYAINFVEGTIAEGDNGDLVAWIKRPESVTWGKRYDWSCEIRMPNGGLLEDSNFAMFKAPELGYTNGFTHQEEANPYRWSDATGDRRFYVRMRDGHMYGRITINLYTYYKHNQQIMIQLSYTINPSGSRILR